MTHSGLSPSVPRCPSCPRGSRACCRTARACSAWIPALPRSQPFPGPAAPQGLSQWDKRLLLWCAAGRTHLCGDTGALGVLPVLSSVTAGTLSQESLSPWHSMHGLAPGHRGAGLAPREMTLGTQEFCLISQQRGQRWEGKVSQVNMKSWMNYSVTASQLLPHPNILIPRCL